MPIIPLLVFCAAVMGAAEKPLRLDQVALDAQVAVVLADDGQDPPFEALRAIEEATRPEQRRIALRLAPLLSRPSKVKARGGDSEWEKILAMHCLERTYDPLPDDILAVITGLQQSADQGVELWAKKIVRKQEVARRFAKDRATSKLVVTAHWRNATPGPMTYVLFADGKGGISGGAGRSEQSLAALPKTDDLDLLATYMGLTRSLPVDELLSGSAGELELNLEMIIGMERRFAATVDGDRDTILPWLATMPGLDRALRRLDAALPERERLFRGSGAAKK